MNTALDNQGIPHTAGQVVAQSISITIHGTTAQHFAVGVPGTNTAIALTGLVDDDGCLRSAANTRRLVACWNACDGISTKNLEDNLPVKELETHYNAVLSQLQLAAQQALEALFLGVAMYPRGGPGTAREQIETAMAALRQAIEADTKPCACCGEGKARISVTRVCDTCSSEYAGQAEMSMARRGKDEQQAEPVAWIEHEWSGSGLRHLHFDRPAPTVRDEVVRPVWTPLYTHPQPAQQPPSLCRQRLKAEGKAYPKSTCQACGSLSPNWKTCDAMLAASPKAPARQPLTDEQSSAVQQQEGEQEPVAATLAFYEDEREPRLLSWNRLPNGEHRLYTRPHPRREPLTDEQIERDIGPDEGDREAVTEIVRQVERAHGIGQEGGAA